MGDILYADTETFSRIPIKNGHYKYAEDVEIMLFAYAFNDEDVSVVDLTAGEALPDRVVDALANPKYTKVFHNSAFDRTVIREGLGLDIPVSQIHDTMIQALAHGLPGALGVLCEVMAVPLEDAKQATGKNLINLFCSPCPKNWKIDRATKDTHPDEWGAFVEYADRDIRAMRVLHKKLPMWNYTGFERELWELDQKINDRGFSVDVDLAEAAIDTIKVRQKILSKRTYNMTLGDVERTTQRDKLIDHIAKYYGIDFDNLRKATVEKALDDPDIPQALKDLLVVRLQASTTSTSKYAALIRSACRDGRLRGTLQFDGASRTRRWAGRLFQPQNLPRPTHDQDEIDFAIEAIKLRCLAIVEPENVMGLVSSSVRGCIIASENKKLCVSDLSNIEGRKGAWFANEDWKLDAFAAFDLGTGHDLYKLAYAKAFGIDPEDVTKDQRQIGKVLELSMQYGGGVGAFLTFAVAYGIDLDELAELVWPNVSARIRREAEDFYYWQKKQRRNMFGLTKETFMACDALKRLWREAHPNITSLWKELENAACSAIHQPGRVFTARRVKFVRKGAWLRCILPSGATLCYPSPRVGDNGEISYMGVNQYTRKWDRIKTYGGKLLENICQSSARDVMAWRMPAIEAAGYAILLTVHDELITEAPDYPEYNETQLSQLLSTQPYWCPDLPLAAGGFEGYRYRKD